jgi:hypothetical protein
MQALSFHLRIPTSGPLTLLGSADRVSMRKVLTAADAVGAVVVLDADYSGWDQTLDDATLLAP